MNDNMSSIKDTTISGQQGEKRSQQQVRIQLPVVDQSSQTEVIGQLMFPVAVQSEKDELLTSDMNQDHQLYDSHQTQNSEHTEMTKETNQSVDRLSNTSELSVSSLLIALRPWSFTASIIPVAVGTSLAYKYHGQLDVLCFLTTVFTALSVHAAGNLVNTYFDYTRGIDTKKSDDRTLVDNILSTNNVVTLGAIFYIMGCAGFLILCFLSPAKMEHLALIYFCGLSSSFFYTGGLGLKYIAMGDILIILTFGPVSVVFSYLSQTGDLSLVPLIFAIPLALNTEAILHCNNVRDMESDKQAGIITLAILLGYTASYCLFSFLLFTPFIMFIYVGCQFTLWMFLPVFSIFLGFQLEKKFRRGELVKLPQEMAKLNLLMGVLFVLAITMADVSTLPKLKPLN